MRAIGNTIMLLSLLGLTTSCARMAADGTGEDPATLLEQARADRAAAETALAEAVRETMPAEPEWIRRDPADEAIHEQLQTVVDLSALKPETPLREAIEIMRTSVEPPLNIVVLWREILENGQIDPTTPIEMDGLPHITLDDALRNLCRSLSNRLLHIEVDYAVDGGVVVICTRDSQSGKRMETRVHEVPAVLRAAGRTEELVYAVQMAIEPDSWLEMSTTGQGAIVTCGDAKLVAWQSPEVHRKIHEFLWAVAEDSPITMPVKPSETILREQLQFLLSYRDTLEKEIDRLHDHQTQRQMMGRPLQETARDLHAIISDLEVFKRDVAMKDGNSPGVRHLDAIIDRARQCLERCGPGPVAYDDFSWLSRSLQPWNSPPGDRHMLAMRLEAKQGELRHVSLKIAAIHDALIGRDRFDPEVRRIQAAAKRLEEADAHVQELEERIGAGRGGPRL